jgi:hypothetical protein
MIPKINITNNKDEKVKYDSGDPTTGYLSDKVVAGTGITLAEGTGADENKLKITNSLDTSGLVPYTGATGNVDLGNNDLILDKDGATGLMKHTTTTGAISYITDKSANWNTAYGWGNHALAGYLTSPDYKSLFRVYQDRAQTVSNGSWEIVQYQAVNYDDSKEFDTASSYKWIVSADGRYHISARVKFARAPLATSYARSYLDIRIIKNGSVWRYGNGRVLGDATPAEFPREINSVSVDDDIWLNRRDEVWIEVYQYNDASSGLDTVAGTEETTFAQHKFNSLTGQ